MVLPRTSCHTRRAPQKDPIQEDEEKRRHEAQVKLQREEPNIVPHVKRVESWDEWKMIDILRRLCSAYIASDRTSVKELEPMARAIGHVLNIRGGLAEMRRVFGELNGIPGSRTLEMHWNRIGDWLG